VNVFQRMGASVKALQIRFGRVTWGGNPWYGRSYSNAARYRNRVVGQGLESSVVVAPISWLQRNTPDAPLRIRTKQADGGMTEIDASSSGPGALLTIWDQPNEYYDGRVLMKALIADYKTTGNAFVIKLRNGSGRWIESWWAPSWSMKARYPDDGSEYLSYWEYNIDGTPQRIETTDIIHWRDGIDPQNPRLGFCAFQSLVREVFTDEEASSFTAALLSNLGVPGVVIAPNASTVGGVMSGRGQILDPAAVKAAFKQTFSGDNRGDAMVLTAPTDVHVLSFNPQQMTLRDLRKIPEERVSGIFGVPAIVSSFGAGLDRSTFANYGEAREAAYEEGVIPLHNDLASPLKRQGLSEFVSDVSGFVLDFDVSEVRVLQEDQTKLWERGVNALNHGGITRSRFKEMVGEKADEDGFDDVYYIPVNLVVTPEAEDQSKVPVESARTIPLTGDLANPGDAALPDAAGKIPGNPLALPNAVPAPSGGNGNGGGTRVPVGGR
jgi:phage portal protein BeeE